MGASTLVEVWSKLCWQRGHIVSTLFSASSQSWTGKSCSIHRPSETLFLRYVCKIWNIETAAQFLCINFKGRPDLTNSRDRSACTTLLVRNICVTGDFFFKKVVAVELKPELYTNKTMLCANSGIHASSTKLTTPMFTFAINTRDDHIELLQKKTTRKQPTWTLQSLHYMPLPFDAQTLITWWSPIKHRNQKL